MPEFAQTILLRDDPAAIDAYVRYHEAVWPEILESLRSLGITRMRIYLAGRQLFMTYSAPEGFVPQRDFMKNRSSPRAAEWERIMRSLQEPVPTAAPGQWWSPMTLVFSQPSPRT